VTWGRRGWGSCGSGASSFCRIATTKEEQEQEKNGSAMAKQQWRLAVATAAVEMALEIGR